MAAQAAAQAVLDAQGFTLRLTDPKAMALLRARISAGFMIIGWALPSLAALTQQGLTSATRVWALLLLVPIPFMAGYILWRGARLGDTAFVLTQCLVEILLVPYTFLVQPRGSLAGQDVALIAPVVISAVFAGRRRDVAVQVAVTILSAAATSWHRIGATADLVPAILPDIFSYICVGFVVRLLRDLATDAVLRAELGEVTDPLTGLLNRRGFERTGSREWTHRAQEHLPLAVLLIDIDHFKRVNDTLGHAAGDELLRQVGTRICSVLRAGDHAYRLGGEEFAVLAHCRPGEAAVIAERVRALMERELPVTVSIGVLEAVPDTTPDSSEAVVATLWRAIDTADKGLYDAKHTGRNRVVATA